MIKFSSALASVERQISASELMRPVSQIRKPEALKADPVACDVMDKAVQRSASPERVTRIKAVTTKLQDLPGTPKPESRAGKYKDPEARKAYQREKMAATRAANKAVTHGA